MSPARSASCCAIGATASSVTPLMTSRYCSPARSIYAGPDREASLLAGFLRARPLHVGLDAVVQTRAASRPGTGLPRYTGPDGGVRLLGISARSDDARTEVHQ